MGRIIEVEIDQPFDLNGRKHWMSGAVSIEANDIMPTGWEVIGIDCDVYDLDANGDRLHGTMWDFAPIDSHTAAAMIWGVVELLDMADTQGVLTP